MSRLPFIALSLLAFFYLASCANIQSGRYIQIGENESLEQLAARHGVSVGEITLVNRGRSFTPGEWIFVPQQQGLIQLFQGKPQYADISYSLEFLNSGKFLWPVPESTRISSKFGPRWGRQHHGIDIAGPIGLAIIAAEDGEVLHAGTMGGYGKLVAIRHAGGYSTVYAHLNNFSVRKGQKVVRGEKIGELGNTGRTTGPHLHFEVRRGTQATDPMAYIGESRNYVIAYQR